MKNGFKRMLSVLLAVLFVVTVFSVCGITATADTPKVYMRYPGGAAKAFTMSFDDGRVNDRMLIEVFEEYDLKSTFYLNSGNFGKGSTLLTESEAVELYKDSGMEVASHTTNHKDLPTVYKEQGNAGLKAEILDDIAKLESLFGNEIYGIAYPGAPPYEFNSPEVIQYLKDNGIGYARSLHGNNKNFEITDNWYVWEPTCQINSEELATYTRKFVDKKVFGDPLLYYVWGHEYDVSAMQTGYMLGTFCEQISGHEDIWYATNGEIYSYIKDYEKLQIFADTDTVTNPTGRSLWICCNRKSYEIKAGATVKGILSGTYVEPSEQTSSIKEESKVSSSSKKADTSSKKSVSSKEDKTSSEEAKNDEMKMIEVLIPGLQKSGSLDSFYEGKITDEKLGEIPVYIPNLAEKTATVLDEATMNLLINKVISKLDGEYRKIIVYYVDITDKEAIQKLIEDAVDTKIELLDINSLIQPDSEQTSVEDKQKEDNGIMQYMWLLIAVAVVVVVALLVVIFLPQIKKLFKK